MFDVIIVIVCAWFAFSNIRSLIALPLNEWEAVNYLLAVVTVLLVIVGVFKLVRVIKAFIGAQTLAKEKAAKMQAEAERDKQAEQAAEDEDNSNSNNE